MLGGISIHMRRAVSGLIMNYMVLQPCFYGRQRKKGPPMKEEVSMKKGEILEENAVLKDDGGKEF